MGYVLHLICPLDMWKASAATNASSPPQLTTSTKSSSSQAAERLSALAASLTPSSSPAPPQLEPSQFVTPAPVHMMQPPLTSMQTIIDNTIFPSPVASTSTLNQNPVKMDATQWKTFTTHLAALSSSQKADFIGRVSRAERYYATLSKLATDRQGPQMTVIGEEAIEKLRSSGQIGTGYSSQTVKEMEESIEQLLDDLGCLTIVRTGETRAAEEFDSVESTQTRLLGGQSNSRIVYISGYPFLLQIPAQFSVPAKDRKEAAVQARRYQIIQMLLSSMLSIARTQQVSQGGFPNFSNAFQLPHLTRAREAGNNFNAAVPPVAGIAMQQGMNRPNGLGAVGIGAQAAARLAGPGMPTARLAVVINLDEIMALAMPLLFLSVKLAFLIYVFGKHATMRKRIVMCVMALAWVIWEGTSIHRRRRAAELRRQQQRDTDQRHPQIQPNERIRIRNLEQAAGPPDGPVVLDPPLDLNGQPADTNALQNGENGAPNGHQQYIPPALTQLQQRLQALGGQQEVRRRHRNGEAVDEEARRNGRPHGSSRSSSHRQPPSRLSPKYWLYLMAKVGLSAEAREMGLSRSVLRQMQATSRQATQNGTPVPPIPAQSPQAGTPSAIRAYQAQPLTLQRALRNLYIGLVLFVGTLIPEVERLRKKALQKREKKLAELELTRRQMHLTNLQAELKRLEDQRKALEDSISGQGESTASGQDAKGSGQTAMTPSVEGNVDPEEHSASALHSATGSEDTRRMAGLGIDALQSSESDSEFFDPPLRREDARAALASTSTSGSSTARTVAPRADTAASPADSSEDSVGPPRIRIQTDAARPNGLLSPLHAVQRRDENATLVLEDDYSAPSTPLLSPAMTEEEDDRQDEGGDDDVGM